MQSFFSNYILKNQFLIALLVVLFGWILLQVIDIVFVFFAAYIIMAALVPVVRFLENKRIPRILSIALPYVALVLTLIFILFPLVTFTSGQVSQAINHFSIYTDNVNRIFRLKLDINQINSFLSSQLSAISGNVFVITTGFFNIILLVFAAVVLSLYMLFYREKFLEFIMYLFPKRRKKGMVEATEHVEEMLGAWLRGQLILSASIGLLTFLGLLVLKIDFALPLAVFAAFMEIVPTIGPIIAAIPAILVALNKSFSTAGLVILMYVVIQTIEGNFLVPQIMKKAVDVNPITIIAAVLIGSKLFGIVGALFAVPIVSLFLTIYRESTKTKV